MSAKKWCGKPIFSHPTVCCFSKVPIPLQTEIIFMVSRLVKYFRKKILVLCAVQKDICLRRYGVGHEKGLVRCKQWLSSVNYLLGWIISRKLFGLNYFFPVGLVRALLGSLRYYIQGYFPRLLGGIHTNFAPLPYDPPQSICLRKIFFNGMCLKCSGRITSGLATRLDIWKRDALGLILKNFSPAIWSSGEVTKISFLEIGAASGIVSLFVAKYLREGNFEGYSICAVEPSLKNCLHMREIAEINSLDVSIIPCALGPDPGFTRFGEHPSKGFVGDAVKVDSMSSSVPQIDAKILLTFVNPTHVYVDAFMNESRILKEILCLFNSIIVLVIEFDMGLPEETATLLAENGFSFVENSSSMNYVYVRANNEEQM